MVKFNAPVGTLIIHEGKSFLPSTVYALFPGSFTLTYRCPKKGRGQNNTLNYSVIIDRGRNEPQVIGLNCK